jgi:hypothetical protein
MPNQCIVKYICVDNADPAALVTDALAQFERHKTSIVHSNFEELHAAVFSGCPAGFRCVEPIALYHEVLWSMGLRVGNGGRCVIARDELHHALEEGEYGLLRWNAPPALSLCVDILPTGGEGAHFF